MVKSCEERCPFTQPRVKLQSRPAPRPESMEKAVSRPAFTPSSVPVLYGLLVAQKPDYGKHLVGCCVSFRGPARRATPGVPSGFPTITSAFAVTLPAAPTSSGNELGVGGVEVVST